MAYTTRPLGRHVVEPLLQLLEPVEVQMTSDGQQVQLLGRQRVRAAASACHPDLRHSCCDAAKGSGRPYHRGRVTVMGFPQEP